MTFILVVVTQKVQSPSADSGQADERDAPEAVVLAGETHREEGSQAGLRATAP